MRTLRAADLFCGAGGTSTGLVEACADLGYAVELTAINHWDVAVATHLKNHPDSRHLCAQLDSVNPRDLYKEGELDLLWASPECTHHSIARGGKPVNDQSRATAWCVVRWAEALRPPIILIENVKEFLSWGAIGTNGRPLRSRRGEVFMSWFNAVCSLGYRGEWRELVAADYGDPTTRRRLFVMFVRGRRKIVWPEPTHAAVESSDLYGTRKRWVPARDIIDWAIEGKSIFKRKKPLADKTLNRIMIGLKRFGLKPFIFGAGGPARAGEPASIEAPLRTVLTRNNSYVANPYLVHLRGNCDAKPLDKPAPALTAGGGHLGLAQPFLIQCNHGNGADKNGDARRVRATDETLPAVAGNRGEWALIEPYLIAIDHHGGHGNQTKSVNVPLSTVTSKQRHAVCQPFLTQFYGNSDCQDLNDPLGTVTTHDRFGLVMPVVEIDGERYLLDIRFRMLKAHELAAAQGFPKSYQFTGNISQVVKQIGNAVPKNLARAIVKAAISQSV